MKKLSVALVVGLFVALAVPATAAAQAGEGRLDGFGVGLGYGTGITGVSLKTQLGDARAFQAVIGCWGGYRNECYGIGGSADLLFNMPIITDEGSVALAWNVGGGGSIGFRDDGWARHPHRDRRGHSMWLAGQFVAGLEFLFPSVPLDLVIEWRPHLYIVPSIWLHFENFGFHVRYYF